ncbi:MAG: 3-keto-5-aminohexanoate cleavage protein [Chloroflexi bacterium]|nr:3-keto-5-aminohexanoate cleavage protein [Chloroflexota bacterium]
MDLLIIEAAINENVRKEENENVPLTPEEIARDAEECISAGASIIHFHARDPKTGEPRYTDASLYAEAMRLIRKRCDAIFYPTYSTQFPMPQRHAHVEALATDKAVRLEMATTDIGSVNMSPFDAKAKTFKRDGVYTNLHGDTIAFLELANRLGVKPTLGAREPGHLRHILAYREMSLLKDPLVVKFMFYDDAPCGLPPTASGLKGWISSIPKGVEVVWSVQAYGRSHAMLQGLAIAQGGHVRTGIGDNPRLDGKKMTNAQQVELFAKVAKRLGRKVAGPKEARRLMGMKPA